MSRPTHSNRNESYSPLAAIALISLVICFMITAVIVSAMRSSLSARASRATLRVTLLASPEKQSLLTTLVDLSLIHI